MPAGDKLKPKSTENILSIWIYYGYQKRYETHARGYSDWAVNRQIYWVVLSTVETVSLLL